SLQKIPISMFCFSFYSCWSGWSGENRIWKAVARAAKAFSQPSSGFHNSLDPRLMSVKSTSPGTF
ncbi:hypothetical protein PJP10_31455, partial [Mycobacterium kansasii]